MPSLTQVPQYNQPSPTRGNNTTPFTGWQHRQKKFQGRLGNASQQLFQGIMGTFGQPGGPGGGLGGGGFGTFRGTRYPRPGDPTVRGHMQELMGGQRQSINDYVQRASQQMGGARGMRVQTGNNPTGQMTRDAAQQLSRGYEGRYGQAMGWAADAARMDQAALGNYMDLLGTLYGHEVDAQRLALQGRQQSHQYNTDLYNRMRQQEMDKRNMALGDRAREQAEIDQNRQRADERHKQAQMDWLKDMWGQATLGGNRGTAFPNSPHIKWDNYVSGPGQALAGRNPGWFLGQ